MVNTPPRLDMTPSTACHPSCTCGIEPRLTVVLPAIPLGITIPNTAHHIPYLPVTMDTPPPPWI